MHACISGRWLGRSDADREGVRNDIGAGLRDDRHERGECILTDLDRLLQRPDDLQYF